ncbi:ras association domain-containing protein 4-like [Huso huso]|uniref:Ras association domain-containing protein 4-like n=1 Tax=Huso huso TaxID=61971 RepID=A0ABR0ZRN3_HUSHU
MDDCQQAPFVKISGDKAISTSDLLSLLKTYNCYHEGKTFQLRNREEEGELIIEGLLNISWGLRRLIRLQMRDDNERVHFSCIGPWRLDQTGLNRNGNAALTVQKENTLKSNNNSVSTEIFSQTLTKQGREKRTGQTPTERAFPMESRLALSTSGPMNIQSSDFSESRYRRSHALWSRLPTGGGVNPEGVCGVELGRKTCSGDESRETSVFTPAYGFVTNVRMNSTMTTPQVLNLLLNKFRVENTSDEFALYLVHETGEQTKQRDTEYPLISRTLHGPCEKIAKIFLMETDLGEEVTYDVSFTIFEMPLLDSFVEKLKEEEEREITKLTRK